MSARAGAGSLVRMLAMLGISAAATAAGTPIELDPGTTFSLYSTDSNDAYEFGRGMLFAANETTTASGALTVMLTPSLAVPPGPSQVMSNEAESVNGPTVVAPANASSPDHAPPA